MQTNRMVDIYSKYKNELDSDDGFKIGHSQTLNEIGTNLDLEQIQSLTEEQKVRLIIATRRDAANSLANSIITMKDVKQIKALVNAFVLFVLVFGGIFAICDVLSQKSTANSSNIASTQLRQ